MKQETPTKVREFLVSEAHEGQRIDNFLLRHLKGVPRSRIYRILRRGEVRVNKGRIKPDYRLRQGDTVRIPPVRTAREEPAPRPGNRVLDLIAQSVFYEDPGLLILNKPSGLAVHGGSGLSYGVIEGLRALRPKAPFLELAHRLDRDTSGCLVIVKKRSVLRAFHGMLREGGVVKRYLALVKGRWAGGRRRIDAPLRKNELRSGERVVRVREDGKAALSLFEPVRVFADCTLMAITLHTGRTHQARVHAAHCGHPIAGDDKYGDSEFNRRMAALGLGRLFLHAHSLRFTLPGETEPVEVEAPLDPKLQAVLDRLEATDEK